MDSRKKNTNILIIRKGLTGGGIERASSLMANYFSSKGINTILLSIYPGDCVFKVDEKVNHIKIVKKEHKNRALRILNIIRLLRKEVKKLNPDVILTYGEYLNSSVIIATRGLNIPVIISDRLSPLFSIGKMYDILKRFTYPFATGCISQTQIAKEILLKRTRNKMKNIIVIPNPINIIKKLDVEKKKQIITIGRLSPEKGQDCLIKAMSKIDHEDWTLLIVGGYKNKDVYDRLKELVKNLKLEERVFFCGRKSDFSKELSESQIFVLPSYSEGYPNALIEAMSVPLPCISSDCVAGPRDIIQNSVNGILVKPGNIEEMRTAIKDLIENPDKRKDLAKEAFKIREKLSKDTIAQQYLDYVLSFIKK